jgi:hypothetical protein
MGGGDCFSRRIDTGSALVGCECQQRKWQGNETGRSAGQEIRRLTRLTRLNRDAAKEGEEWCTVGVRGCKIVSGWQQGKVAS